MKSPPNDQEAESIYRQDGDEKFRSAFHGAEMPTTQPRINGVREMKEPFQYYRR